LLVWRIAREPFQALDGEGARLNGGRWSSEGVLVIYTSTSLALAALEYLVHVDPVDVPDDLVAMAIEIPDNLAEERISVSDLPQDWNEVADHPSCLSHGNAWAQNGRTALLRVPSAIVIEEENMLINPGHVEAGRIAVKHVRPFSFDPRLLA
jgi:RES domain-containing protein